MQIDTHINDFIDFVTDIKILDLSKNNALTREKVFLWLHQKHEFTSFAVFHAQRFVYFLPENFKFQRWIEIGRYQLSIFVYSSFKAKFPNERKKGVRSKIFF